MAVPINYRRSNEQVIASYDYYDLGEGTGIKTLYGAKLALSGSTLYLLTPNEAVLSSTAMTTTGEGTVTMNFDLSPFNMPKIVTGTAYFSAPLANSAAGGTGSKLWVQVQKVSEGVVSNVSSEVQGANLYGNSAHSMEFIPITVNRTHFKKGDILRLVVKLICGVGGGTAETTHDPAGRDGTDLTSATTAPVISTKMRLYMPFLVDL